MFERHGTGHSEKSIEKLVNSDQSGSLRSSDERKNEKNNYSVLAGGSLSLTFHTSRISFIALRALFTFRSPFNLVPRVSHLPALEGGKMRDPGKEVDFPFEPPASRSS